MGAGPAVVTVRVKPRLRGVLHEIAFFVAVALAVPLLWTAPAGRARVAAVVFALCVPLCFGASALYHRPTWSPGVRSWLARVDHAGLYLLIAGTYTPFGLLVLSRAWAIPVLAVVWGGALAAILLKLFWPTTPKWASAIIALSLGWTGAAALGELAQVGAPALTLIAAGGLLYTAGAIIYARKRPDPAPALFGYHEIFHACTIGGAACTYAAVAFFVLPNG
jgi:hemolysin III